MYTSKPTPWLFKVTVWSFLDRGNHQFECKFRTSNNILKEYKRTTIPLYIDKPSFGPIKVEAR